MSIFQSGRRDGSSTSVVWSLGQCRSPSPSVEYVRISFDVVIVSFFLPSAVRHASCEFNSLSILLTMVVSSHVFFFLRTLCMTKPSSQQRASGIREMLTDEIATTLDQLLASCLKKTIHLSKTRSEQSKQHTHTTPPRRNTHCAHTRTTHTAHSTQHTRH